jgi:nitrogen-specific signal transduction histidine kinase
MRLAVDCARHERLWSRDPGRHRALFRAVFFDAADAMLILDDERTVHEANPAACELFGVAEDGVVGSTLDALIVDVAGSSAGLGLASVYGIVRQSNGFIAVESEPDAGSVFTMHFPAVADAATHQV